MLVTCYSSMYLYACYVLLHTVIVLKAKSQLYKALKHQKDCASLRLSNVKYVIWTKNKGNLKSVLYSIIFCFCIPSLYSKCPLLWLSVIALKDRLWPVLLSNLKISIAGFEQRGVVMFQKLLIQTFLGGYFIGQFQIFLDMDLQHKYHAKPFCFINCHRRRIKYPNVYFLSPMIKQNKLK